MKQVTIGLQDALKEVGGCGRYQYSILILLIFANIPCVSQVMMFYFATLSPSWKCIENSTVCLFNGTLSPTDYRKCDIPRSEWYFTEENEFSIVTQFDIICDREWLLQLATSTFFAGWALGSICLGWFSDRYGRKKVILISLIIVLVNSFILPFMPNIYLVLALRLVTGFFYPGILIQSFVLLMELLGSNYRERIGLQFFLVIPLSFIILAIKAYFTKNWKLMSLVTTGPYCVVLLFYRFLPESPEWLESQGKQKELIALFKTIARVNKRHIDDDICIKEEEKSYCNDTKFVVLFKTSRLVFRLLTLSFLWIAVNMINYGILMAANDISGSKYRDFIILSCESIFSTFFGVLLYGKFGTKNVILFSTLISGVLCMSVAFIPNIAQYKVLRLLLAFCGKFLNTVAYNGLYAWSAKLYHVTARSKAVGVLTAAARLGAISAPWITKGLQRFGYLWMPLVVLSAPSIIATFLSLWLKDAVEVENTNEEAVNDDFGMVNIGHVMNDEPRL